MDFHRINLEDAAHEEYNIQISYVNKNLTEKLLLQIYTSECYQNIRIKMMKHLTF